MGRKLVVWIAAAAVLAVAAVPAAAAEVYRVRASETVVVASFTSTPNGEWKESLPPGDYFSTQIIAAAQLAEGSEAYEENYVCLFHEEFTVDAAGEFSWTDGVFACGPVTTMSVDRRLLVGRLVASLPVVDCGLWDEETGECLELIELGTVEIDLVFEGVGPIERQRGVSTGGTAGQSTYVYHGTGALRHAVPGGIATFNAESLIDGATTVDGLLARASAGWLDVSLGG